MIELIPVAVLQNRIMQASTNGITYFRRNSDSFTSSPVDLAVFSAAAISSISFNSVFACSALRDRKSAPYAASLFPRRNNQRGDSATSALPITNNRPGGSDTQNMRLHAWSLKANTVAASANLVTSATL